MCTGKAISQLERKPTNITSRTILEIRTRCQFVIGLTKIIFVVDKIIFDKGGNKPQLKPDNTRYN